MQRATYYITDDEVEQAVAAFQVWQVRQIYFLPLQSHMPYFTLVIKKGIWSYSFPSRGR